VSGSQQVLWRECKFERYNTMVMQVGIEPDFPVTVRVTMGRFPGKCVKCSEQSQALSSDLTGY
jgi:hypothetical protein